MQDKIYLIDGMSLVFRAYHAMLSSNLKNASGEPTGAIFGFVNTLSSILEKENPQNILVVFDTEQPTFRHKMYDKYKANRQEFPEELAPQLLKIKKFIELIGIKQLELPGYEADDLIGTIAKRASENNWKAVCITSDKDYYQLVDDNISLMKPGRHGEDFEIVQREQVLEKFGVAPENVVDVLSLIGDSSDNVPGVKGIGEKTAIPIIQKFKTIENIYDNLGSIEKDSVRNKLINDKENAFLAKKLVTIEINVPISFNIEDAAISPIDPSPLDAFFAEQSFITIREKWRKKLNFTGAQADTVTNIDEQPINYQTVTKEKLKEVIEYLRKFDAVSFDFETDSLDRMTCEIVEIALSAKENEAFYLPIGSPYSAELKSDPASLFAMQSDSSQQDDRLIPYNFAISQVKLLLEDEKVGKCGQNVKFDAFIAKRIGIDVRPIIFDSMVADYLLNPDERHNLDALSERWLNYKPIAISELIGEKKSKQISMRQVDIETAARYACEDADLALKLKNMLHKKLLESNMSRLADEIEFPLIYVLTDMEHRGVKIDTSSLKEISENLAKEIEILRKEIYDMAGEAFNIDSPKQLGEILFEKLQIPIHKKTKTGYSTDAQVLAELATKFPIADVVLRYRQLVKLKSTYLDALPELMNIDTGKVHTTYNQTVASTGRLSSTDPNLQNIPIRTEIGREIRRAFIPSGESNVIISADYSQIELRVMAHICNDKNLINAFKNNIDIHSATASTLFGVSLDEVTASMRRTAKTVNFGILYGLGSFGLSQRLGISRKEASDIISNYFAKYPSIKEYINKTIELTRQNGYAETLCGRRRYFSDINSKNSNVRAAAERAAINMPIQGTASDMIKIAMIRIFNRLNSEQLNTRMIMQVHDELVFDGPKDEYTEASAIITEEMVQALPLGEVPIGIEINFGKSWLEAH